MRRLLCIMLALGLLCSLAACGKDKEPTTDPSATEVQTVPIPSGPQKIEGKQEFWEKIIKNKTYQPATNSLTLSINDFFVVSALNDNRERFAFTFSEAITTPAFDGTKEYSIYRVNSEEMYYQEKSAGRTPTEANRQEVKWLKMLIDDKDERQALANFIKFATSKELPGMSLFDAEMKNLQSVEYVQTENGKDELVLHCVEKDTSVLPLAPRSDGNKVHHYAIHEVEYNGEKGVFVLLIQDAEFISVTPEQEVEEVEEGEDTTEPTEPRVEIIQRKELAWLQQPSWYTSSLEAGVGTDTYTQIFDIGKDRAESVIKQDLLANPERTIVTDIIMIMDPAKQAVCSMSMQKGELSIQLEYVECATAIDLLNMPFFTEEKIASSEATQDIISRMNRVLQNYLADINY